MALAFYLSGTSTLATTHAFTATPGVPSTAWALDHWLNKGTPGGWARNVRLQLKARATGSGDPYVTSGLQCLDKAEFQIRCNGFFNPSNDAEFVPQTRDWLSIGTGISFREADLRGNCANALEIRYAPRVDTSSASGAWDVGIEVSYDESSEAAPVGVSESSGVGILTGVGDPRISEWVEGPAVTETSGTPDAYVQVSRRWCVLAGVSRRWLAAAVEANQSASGGALTAGQAYVAILTQGASGLTVTKGAAALLASVVAPAAPAGELPIARVIVNYQAGGTSVIANADITVYADSGRGRVVDTTGLVVSVSRLRALVDRAVITRPIAELVTLPDSSTTTVWLTSSGAISLTAGTVALAAVTTAGGDVTGIVDLRTYVEPGMEVVRLRYGGYETFATGQDRERIPWRCNLDRISAAVMSASAGATGQTILDVYWIDPAAGGTIFTGGGGTPESRPLIPAGSFIDDGSYPEVTVFPAGSYFSLDTDEITVGGTQAGNVECDLMVYPLR